MTSSNHSLPSTLKSYEEEEAETFLNPAKYMTPKRKNQCIPDTVCRYKYELIGMMKACIRSVQVLSQQNPNTEKLKWT